MELQNLIKKKTTILITLSDLECVEPIVKIKAIDGNGMQNGFIASNSSSLTPPISLTLSSLFLNGPERN